MPERDGDADDAGEARGQPLSSTPFDAVAGERAVGDARGRLACRSKPWSIATFSSPSGELLAKGLTKNASPSATRSPPTTTAPSVSVRFVGHHGLPATTERSRSSQGRQQILRAVDEVGSHAEHDARR